MLSIAVCSNPLFFYKINSLLAAILSCKRCSCRWYLLPKILSCFSCKDSFMKIHEYQAKAILKKYGVSVPRGSMAASREEAEAVAETASISGASGVVVKAQIHAGGRGKGGGVKIAKSVDEAGELAAKMLGMKLVTHQTGPEGRIVRRLLIEETSADREGTLPGHSRGSRRRQTGFMASAAGGMDIEQVAAETPDAILKQYIDPGMGLEAFQARKIAFKLG